MMRVRYDHILQHLLQWRHMSAMASQITGISTACSSLQRSKHQSSILLAFLVVVVVVLVGKGVGVGGYILES